MPPRIWTIGHSNHELQLLLDILVSHGIRAVADVRRFPGSRRHPQFGSDPLREALQEVEIGYHHFPELGGRRTSQLESSPNAGWRVAAFRAYADYMLTDEFAASFNKLEALAREAATAMMCAEVLPWRCHRRLLADQFVVRGWEALDIMGIGKAARHELPAFAKVAGGMLTYPGEE